MLMARDLLGRCAVWCMLAVPLAGWGCGGSIGGSSGGSPADSGLDADVATSPADAGGDATDAAAYDAVAYCEISAANYDTSCSTASDCISDAGGFPVQFGNYCQTSTCWCGGDAINRNSAKQYVSDVSKTPWGSGAVVPPACSCPVYFGPCCIAGQCSTNCPSPCISGCPDGSASDASGE